MANNPEDVRQTEELLEQATLEAESRLAELDDEEDPRIGAPPAP